MDNNTNIMDDELVKAIAGDDKINLELNSDSIIMVIGVGGAGGNAVNHMYGEGIDDVNFAIFNTDYQDLLKSKIPVKLQLGKATTNGLGAGGNPEKGRQAAEESKEEIKDIWKNIL